MYPIACVVVGIFCMFFQMSSYSQEIKYSINDPIFLVYQTNRNNSQLNTAIYSQIPSDALTTKKQSTPTDFFFSKNDIPRGKITSGFIPFPAVFGASHNGHLQFVAGTTGPKSVLIIKYIF